MTFPIVLAILTAIGVVVAIVDVARNLWSARTPAATPPARAKPAPAPRRGLVPPPTHRHPGANHRAAVTLDVRNATEALTAIESRLVALERQTPILTARMALVAADVAALAESTAQLPTKPERDTPALLQEAA